MIEKTRDCFRLLSQQENLNKVIGSWSYGGIIQNNNKEITDQINSLQFRQPKPSQEQLSFHSSFEILNALPLVVHLLVFKFENFWSLPIDQSLAHKYFQKNLSVFGKNIDIFEL